jgi:hypothetical protein
VPWREPATTQMQGCQQVGYNFAVANPAHRLARASLDSFDLVHPSSTVGSIFPVQVDHTTHLVPTRIFFSFPSGALTRSDS